MLLSEHTTIFLQNVCSHCGGVHSAPTTSPRPGTSKHGEKEEPGGSRSDFDEFFVCYMGAMCRGFLQEVSQKTPTINP